jgi:geranylgeranyl diphosphate synthase type II
MTLQLKEVTHRLQKDILEYIEPLLKPLAQANTLSQSIHYSLEGGKILRPLLMVAINNIVKAPYEHILPMACAIELVHSYSLIHDDLPSMDNDASRRGKPSVWSKFGEAEAILTGDALQSLAFECIAQSAIPSSSIKQIVSLFARDLTKMVIGQMKDIECNQTLSLKQMKEIHQLKTGALFHFSCVVPTLLEDVSPEVKDNIENFAESFGELYQIIDDLQDTDPKIGINPVLTEQKKRLEEKVYASISKYEPENSLILQILEKVGH